MNMAVIDGEKYIAPFKPTYYILLNCILAEYHELL